MCHLHAMSLYPYGYFSEKQTNHIDLQGDSTIDELWAIYASHPTSVDLNRVRLETISHAMSLFEPFGGFIKWANAQLQHAHLTPNMEKFLRQTVEYLVTGRRLIQPEAFIRILNEERRLNVSGKKATRPLYPVTNDDLVDESLAIWIGHSGGFQDLIWTLKVLFGTNK